MADPSLENQLPPEFQLPPRPPGIEKEIYLIATSMTILPLIAIALRFYARNLKKTGLSWDDFMILPAMLGTIATAISMYIGTSIGDLGRHTYTFMDPMDGLIYPIATPRTRIFQQIQYAAFTSTILTFGFTKLAVLLFYKRIFQGALFNAACWIMIGLVFVWTVGFTFSQIFQCFPISLNWEASTGGWAEGQCIDVYTMLVAQAWSDVATNVAIILLPLGCIWELKMPFWKKVGVYTVFLLGALTVGFGVAKLVAYNRIFSLLKNPDILDLTFIQTPMVYWPMIESGVGIIGACLPLMRPLISGASSHGFMRKLRTFNGTTSDNSDTFWEHSDNTALRDEWNNSVSSTKFGSASQTSMKSGGSVSTTEIDPKSHPKKLQASISTMKWGTESLPPVDRDYHYAEYNSSPRKGSNAVPMRQLPKSKLGILDDDDDDFDDYHMAPRNPRRPREVV